MDSHSIVVSYQAQEQFNRLSAKQQSDLTRLLSEDGPSHTRMEGQPDRYISRLGANLRVLWRKAGAGKAEVLSIVTK